ncbi:MAG: Mfa1 fimbrilin C-terminal domain-containing protein, partial [Bacteroides sp.]
TEALKGNWNQMIEGVVPSFTNEIKNIVFFSAFIQNAINKKGVGLSTEEATYFEADQITLKPKYTRLLVVKFINGSLGGVNKAIATAKETATPGEILNVKLDQAVINGISFKDEAFAVGDLKFYKGGDNYYFLYVKHFKHSDQAPQLHQYGRYGVVRNNVYKVNVTKLLRPGEPTITPPVTGEPSIPAEPVDPENPKPTEPIEPDEPIDGKELAVAYEVEILPWFIREQDYEVK